MKKRCIRGWVACVLLLWSGSLQAQVLEPDWKHLRNAGSREWSDFPVEADLSEYSLHFTAAPNNSDLTLTIRQYDVKLNWRVILNGADLGSLVADEKDLISYYTVRRNLLAGDNRLTIACKDQRADDIRLGEITLLHKSPDALLSESHLEVEIRDAESDERIPGRITITNGMGILQTVSGSARDPLALRPGYVYTGNGNAVLGLPAGSYKVYGGRGFEYGVDSATVELGEGDYQTLVFRIKREVPTSGWVSSDTHVHTYTWSGHGDASASERALSIAGEGIELPVMTDHNIAVDLAPFARDLQLTQYFTPVTGNEVTTPVGHFNVFPVDQDGELPFRANNWSALSKDLSTDKNRAIILNHARDIHLNFRPFDPKRHLAVAGMRLDDQPFFANAMEVINSGSQQTDQQELLRDWLGLLNQGLRITPAGSSDSHDVSRYFVGQARTYIRCDDKEPGNINAREAIANFLEGNVMVSFGLLAEIEINDAYGPGELAPASTHVKISVTVSGPAWRRAEKVVLYANGVKIREEKIDDNNIAGVKWSGDWYVAPGVQDMFLVAVAEGPADSRPFWPIARPYQPASPEWNPRIWGISGAVWVDLDRNGRRNSAKDYAEQLLREASGDLEKVMRRLNVFDEAVAAQVAALLFMQGDDLTSPAITNALRRAAPQTRSGFQLVMQGLSIRPH